MIHWIAYPCKNTRDFVDVQLIAKSMGFNFPWTKKTLDTWCPRLSPSGILVSTFSKDLDWFEKEGIENFWYSPIPLKNKEQLIADLVFAKLL